MRNIKKLLDDYLARESRFSVDEHRPATLGLGIDESASACYMSRTEAEEEKEAEEE